jgi:hypothetical protein
MPPVSGVSYFNIFHHKFCFHVKDRQWRQRFMAPSVRLLALVVAGALAFMLLGISAAGPVGQSLLLAVRPARRAGSAAAPGASDDSAMPRPPAVALFAPHKTGSTFFVSFLSDLSEQLGTCLFTENAAFLYSPRDRTRCSSPACGHPPTPSERRYPSGDSGWGECTSFTDEKLRQAAACMATPKSCSLRSATRGLIWGPIRLPPAMRSAAKHAAEAKWDWSLILHQRHPLDTLVSEFHSFGWVHPPAPEATPGQRKEHERRQERIRNVTADEYVSTRLQGLRDRCRHRVPHLYRHQHAYLPPFV